ncbi:BCCT family transporter [Thiomicrorhabdus sediminis]|nr:BCCT family transporter [Thiomicrorhabdus sediminis]
MQDEQPLIDTDYEVGQDNVQVLGLDIHNPVFLASSALILTFVVATLMVPEAANNTLNAAKTWSIENFDWLFMIGGNIFVLFSLFIILSPMGRIRLGGKQAKPQYSRLSWFSMLFAAGMGIGLMFWSVAEPLAYYTDWWGTPLNVDPNTPQAADMAMGATMFHWGLHPWAMYGIVGLALGFFAYNHDLPFTVRSTFYPLLGERVWGPIGDFIDILAVLATIFGLATSLGFGAQQAAGGIEYLFDIPATTNVQIAIIIGVTAIAIFSVMRGVNGGVRVLSNINMSMAALLLLFVLIVGPTLAILGTIYSTTTSYATEILSLSNWIGREDDKFYTGWTVFYWAWWISWSPFVGIFIARISKGRTIREFLIAVMLVPTVVSIIWMSVFGGSVLEQVQAGVGPLADGLDKVELAMFQMLHELPLAQITSFVAIVLVLVFFITSSDSGSLVIDSITAGGQTKTPYTQRVFWAVLEGIIAGALLFIGGKEALSALQAGAITTGLPFTIVLLAMCVSLYIGLRHEVKNNL